MYFFFISLKYIFPFIFYLSGSKTYQPGLVCFCCFGTKLLHKIYCHKNERLEKGLQEHHVKFYKNITLRELHILATRLKICKFRILKHTALVALRYNKFTRPLCRHY